MQPTRTPAPAPAAAPGWPPAYGQPNPMMAMMQMFAGMMGQQPMVDPAAMPFAAPAPAVADSDPGLDADIVRPATIANLVKKQEALHTGTVLDYLCLDESGAKSLGGVPKGCTIALAGPPASGKTRTAIATLCRAAARGEKVAFVVAEEGFRDEGESGRDDLASRLAKIGMAATGLGLEELRAQVLENVYVMQSQYHKGRSWDDFVQRYRYLIEKTGVKLVVVDSLNMLDPQGKATADHMSVLKTYNHEKGVTCICIGQIKDTGAPQGGEPLMHAADTVFLLETMYVSSKEMGAEWGANAKDYIPVITAVKSVTTPTFAHKIRVERDATTGALMVSAKQPAAYAVK